jgi:hypothetical protein
MPSVSNKQKRFMAAAAHSPEFAKKAGIDQSVARDFYRADQAKKRRGAIEKAFRNKGTSHVRR